MRTSFQKSAPPVLFIPFELSLATHLAKRSASLESVLDSSLGIKEQAICNKQVSGRLRVYPTGVGVVRITIALEFRSAIHVAAVAQIARAFEQMLFMDADGNAHRCETFLLDVIERLVYFLFHRRYSLTEARWRPAETIYCFKPFYSGALQSSLKAFAHLIAAAPGNEESPEKVHSTLRQAVRMKSWTLDSVLASASQRVSLFAVCPSNAIGQENRRAQILEWLTETAEVVWVTSYAIQAILEELQRLLYQGILDEEWLSNTDNTAHVGALLSFASISFKRWQLRGKTSAA